MDTLRSFKGRMRDPQPPPASSNTFPFVKQKKNASTKDGRVQEAEQEEKPASGAESWYESYLCPLQVTCHRSRAGSWSFAFLARETRGTGQWGSFGIRSKTTCRLRSQKRQKRRRTVLRFYCPTLHPAPKRVRIATEGVSCLLPWLPRFSFSPLNLVTLKIHPCSGGRVTVFKYLC